MPAAAKRESPFRNLHSIRQPPPPENTATTPAGPGRPIKPGSKRSNPDYKAWTGLLPIQVMKDVRIRLSQTNDTRDVSDLTSDLLAEWLEQTEAKK